MKSTKVITVGRARVLAIWGILTLLGFSISLIIMSTLPQSAFRDAFLGNWLATIVGVIAGIPIALWLSRMQQSEQDKEESRKHEEDSLRHKGKIIGLIKEELVYNRSILQSQTEQMYVTELVINRAKDETWNAFSDGGELQWINDHALLDLCSSAYHQIMVIILLQERLLIYQIEQNIQHDPIGTIRKTMQALYPHALYHIDKAIAEINNNLGD
jgi:hypothetical protein